MQGKISGVFCIYDTLTTVVVGHNYTTLLNLYIITAVRSKGNNVTIINGNSHPDSVTYQMISTID